MAGVNFRIGRERNPPPSWLGAVGEWSTVAGGSLSASGVQQDFSGGAGVFAYSGGVINTNGVYDGASFVSGTFLILWGGGHADYGGNEVYAFGPMENDTPAWRRLRDRTSTYPTNVNEDGSGNPVSRHTYGNICYLPSTNEMIAPGGLYRYTDASPISVAHTFDFDQASPNTNMPWSTAGSGLVGPQYAAYEAASGRIWFRQPDSNVVGYYDLATDTQTTAAFKSPPAGDGHGAIDSARGIWAMIAGGNTLKFYRTNNGVSNDYYTPSTTGTAPTGYDSLLYDAVDDVFRFWSDNGKELFTLTPPGTNPYEGGNAWTWSSVTPSGGSTPGSANATGTYGRFGYVNSTNFRGYLLLNSVSSSAYFYRAA